MSDIAKLGFEIDSTPLARAANAAQRATQQIGAVGDAADRMGRKAREANQQVSPAAQGVAGFGQAAQAAAQRLDGLTGALAGMGGGQGGLVAATGLLGRGLAGVSGVLGGMGGLAAGAAAGAVVLTGSVIGLTTALAEAQDKAALLDSRLRNAFGSNSDAKRTLEEIYTSTQRTGLGFDSAADAVLRIARNAEAIGATRDEILQLSDTIQKLGKASGASTGEIQSGMVQLGQALASGRLNGDELRSIMESMPALAKAIADGLGVSVGQIRAMGAAGELTSDKVFRAILAASAKANEEFAKLPDTVAQANQRTADAWDRLLATLGQKWDSSSLVRNSVNWLANLINGASNAMQAPGIGDEIRDLERRREQIVQRGAGVENQRQLDSVDRRLAELRARAQAELAADSAAREQKEIQLNRNRVQQGIELGQNEYDDYSRKVEKARKDSQRLADTIAEINIRIKSGIATPEDRAALPALARQASVARAEYEQLAAGIEKASRSLSDLRRAQAIGGGGGGTAIVSQAIQQQREAQRQQGDGAASLDSFIGAGVAEAAARAQAEVQALNRQADAQVRLTASVGATRSAVRELEIAQAAADFRFKNFGTLTTPEAEKAVNEYTVALRRNREAQDAMADARAFQAMAEQVAGVQAQIEAVTRGAAAMRRAAAQASAAAADRQTPGLGARQLQAFEANERLTAEQELDRLRREAERNRRFGDAAGDPARLRGLQLDQRVEDAQRQFGNVPGLESAIRDGDEADRTRQLQEQTAQLERQLRNTRERSQLVGLTGDQLAVQTALLERRQQLEAQGVNLTSSYAQEQMRVTEELARQQVELDRQQRQAAAYERAWQNAADGIQSALAGAFEEVFTTGRINGESMLRSLSNLAAKVASQIMSAMIQPAIDPLVAAARTFGQSLIPGLFPSASPAANQFNPPIDYRANGGAYGPGGRVLAFANGGAFTNSVVDRPTMFAFANGGALGVMGEAGPEAIMPLRRGANGRLGVEAAGGGGGVSITVIDQRTSADAAPVGVSEGRGPDGQRLIRVLVRDEVRRAIRSGDLDKDMGTAFGNRRQLVTR